MTYAPIFSVALGVLAGIGLIWLLAKLFGLISCLNLWRHRIVNMYKSYDNSFDRIYKDVFLLRERVAKLEEKSK